MSQATANAQIIFVAFVMVGLAFGVDWVPNDQKYLCDCNDVPCLPYEWLWEHIQPLFWLIVFIGGLVAVLIYVETPRASRPKPKPTQRDGEFTYLGDEYLENLQHQGD